MSTETTQSDVNRRKLLQASTLAFFGGLGAAAPAVADGSSGSAKRCILVYLLGGPPHLDMWDLKPKAPKEIRGPFQPIPTDVPGLMVGEHLPKLAQQGRRLSILRSLTYRNNDHPFMTYYTLTGRVSDRPLGANTVLPPSRSEHPHMGAVVSRFVHANPQVPGYVAIPEVRIRMKEIPIAGGGRAGFLGPRYDPFLINDDARQPPKSLALPEDISSERFSSRDKLLAVLDGQPARSRKTLNYTTSRKRAVQLMHAVGSNGLFSLDAEPASLRDNYGRGRFGQSLLLARRLVERDVSYVAVHFNHMSKCDGWDLHSKNFDALKGELLPMVDRGIAALLDDLAERGLLEETLVVVMGEFGRTPKINGKAGRDHWGQCASVMFAGGGLRGGNVVGASDATGAYPSELPVGPPDVVATIYRALGLAPHAVMHDQLSRPVPLSIGKAIDPLFTG